MQACHFNGSAVVGKDIYQCQLIDDFYFEYSEVNWYDYISEISHCSSWNDSQLRVMVLTVTNPDQLNAGDQGLRFLKINPLDLMHEDWDVATALEISTMLADHHRRGIPKDSYFYPVSCQLRQTGILLAKIAELPDLLMAVSILSLSDLVLRLRWSCEREALAQHPILSFIDMPEAAQGNIGNALAPIYHLLNHECLFQSGVGEFQICSLICDHSMNATLSIPQHIQLREKLANSMLPLPPQLEQCTDQ